MSSLCRKHLGSYQATPTIPISRPPSPRQIGFFSRRRKAVEGVKEQPRGRRRGAGLAAERDVEITESLPPSSPLPSAGTGRADPSGLGLISPPATGMEALLYLDGLPTELILLRSSFAASNQSQAVRTVVVSSLRGPRCVVKC